MVQRVRVRDFSKVRHQHVKVCTSCGQFVAEEDCFPSEWAKCPSKCRCKKCTQLKSSTQRQLRRKQRQSGEAGPAPKCQACGNEEILWDPLYSRPKKKTKFVDPRVPSSLPKHLRYLCVSCFETLYMWWMQHVRVQRANWKRNATKQLVTQEEADYVLKTKLRYGPPTKEALDEWLNKEEALKQKIQL